MSTLHYTLLRDVAIAELTLYVGEFSELLVDEAFELASRNEAYKRYPSLQLLYFFICLNKRLPPKVPYKILRDAIVKKFNMRMRLPSIAAAGVK